jgi:hypothetical protein
MRVLAGHLIANCASLLHTKIKDNKTISGYFGGATHGYNLAAIEVLQPGLGVFLDTIYVAFKMPRGGIVKILQYCQKVGRFPLHNDEPRDKRLFRISVSLADGIPDFAMCFDGSRRTYVMARGFMTMIVMDMHAAGRLHDPSGKGLIKHGTVRTPTTDCPFVVFDVEAGSWEELHLMIDAWVKLLGGLAVGTAIKFGSNFAQTAWTVIVQAN